MNYIDFSQSQASSVVLRIHNGQMHSILRPRQGLEAAGADALCDNNSKCFRAL